MRRFLRPTFWVTYEVPWQMSIVLLPVGVLSICTPCCLRGVQMFLFPVIARNRI